MIPMNVTDLHARLIERLDRHDSLVIAVSGGIDSLTLAFAAHRFAGGDISMVHASSPAVPAQATARVRSYAAREDWRLAIVDAGEFFDPNYRANPSDRCYYCKSHLYDRIRADSDRIIASGANLDDLDDYRPGLKAAAERSVIHPYVDCGIDKEGVRRLARWYGLSDIADLPAQPCLASRVETGIVIDPDDLDFANQVECLLIEQFAKMTTVRCRITHDGVAVEVDGLEHPDLSRIGAVAQSLCFDNGRKFSGVRSYHRGSAFIRPAGDGI